MDGYIGITEFSRAQHVRASQSGRFSPAHSRDRNGAPEPWRLYCRDQAIDLTKHLLCAVASEETWNTRAADRAHNDKVYVRLHYEVGNHIVRVCPFLKVS